MTLRNRTYLPRTGRFASRADGQVVMSGPGVGTGCGPSSLRNSIHRRLTSCQMTCWSLKNASSRPSSRSWAGVVTRSSPSHRGSAAAGMAGIPRTTVDAAVRARAVTSATKARDRNRALRESAQSMSADTKSRKLRNASRSGRPISARHLKESALGGTRMRRPRHSPGNLHAVRLPPLWSVSQLARVLLRECRTMAAGKCGRAPLAEHIFLFRLPDDDTGNRDMRKQRFKSSHGRTLLAPFYEGLCQGASSRRC